MKPGVPVPNPTSTKQNSTSMPAQGGSLPFSAPVFGPFYLGHVMDKLSPPNFLELILQTGHNEMFLFPTSELSQVA